MYKYKILITADETVRYKTKVYKFILYGKNDEYITSGQYYDTLKDAHIGALEAIKNEKMWVNGLLYDIKR